MWLGVLPVACYGAHIFGDAGHRQLLVSFQPVEAGLRRVRHLVPLCMDPVSKKQTDPVLCPDGIYEPDKRTITLLTFRRLTWGGARGHRLSPPEARSPAGSTKHVL